MSHAVYPVMQTFPSASFWKRECAVRFPSISEAGIDHAKGYSHLLANIYKGARDSIYANLDRISSVSGLFFLGGPAKIFWFVPTIIVNTVQGVFGGWPFSNIIHHPFTKGLVIVFPLRSYINSSTEIIIPVLGGIRATSPFYATPSHVERGLLSPFGFSMNQGSVAEVGSPEASATKNFFSDFMSNSNKCFAAIAKAFPASVIFGRWAVGKLNDKEPAMSSSGAVFNPNHFSSIHLLPTKQSLLAVVN